MIIDSHAHMGKGYDLTNPIQSNIPPECLLKMAREAGVDKTIVFPVDYPEYSGAMKEIHDAVKKYPDELIGYARVNPDNDNAIEVLTTAIEEYRFKGLKLHPGNDKWKVNSSATRKILNHVRKYNVPVLFDPVVQLEDIFALINEYGDINFIIAHMGGFCDWKIMERCITLAENKKNIYLDTPFAMVHVMLKEAANRIPDKLFMGTDSPAIHPAVEMEKIRSLGISKEVEAKILGENIRRLLNI
jgi:predicted TIM-barrel fold metal-dependent hydrolase